MANEYLNRTPTSTGNRKVFTWSGWLKKSELSTGFGRLFEAGADVNNRSYFTFRDGDELEFVHRDSGSVTDQLISDYEFRDPGSFAHFMIAVNSTASSTGDRIKIYVNGVLLTGYSTSNLPSANQEFDVNSLTGHYLGNSVNQAADLMGSMSDVFFVDGQALTPDVFGFYKDGKGYQSSGTSQATDFRPGQWSPHSPRKIKSDIERRGGFGVNGFYLPMNDSSNPGADFHTTPNSIITLKGEGLPQPRNGAPTTSDTYVSQLRTDPYAANLVLAVPGISTSTSGNLITNGTFDSNVSGWTAVDATITWSNGRAQTNRTGGSGYTGYQAITVESGKRYTLSGIIDSTGGGNRQDLRILDNLASSGGSMVLNISGTNNEVVQNSGSFTASQTTYYVYLVSDNTGTGFFDNVVVKQEDAPRDYSAYIKGSGINKTLIPNGSAGVGYEIPGYYGSGMSFPNGGVTGGDDALRVTSDDFAMGTGDFTVEVWINPDSVYNYKTIFSTRPNNSGYTDGFNLWIDANGKTGVYSNAFLTQTASGTINPNQWTHVVAERYNGQLTTYINGVAAAVQLSNTQNYTRTVASIGLLAAANQESFTGQMQDLRVYKGVAKYKGGFDIPKPYAPVGIESWRAVPDCTANNFMTMSPLSTENSSGGGLNLLLSDGNLTTGTDGTANQSARGSFSVSSGKWYFETTLPSATGLTSQNSGVGVAATNIGGVNGSSGSGYAILYREGGGAFLGNGASRSDPAAGTHATYVAGDIIGVALDIDNGNVEFFKNGASAATYNFPTHAVSGTDWTIESLMRQSNSVVVHNFGQNPTLSGRFTAGTNADDSGKGLFKYEPPTGFLALCEDNLPTPSIADPGEHFKTVLWTGDGNGGRNVTGVGFAPDLVWVKRRSATAIHFLFDSVRGAGAYLQSSSTAAELVDATNTLMSFDSDGFTSGNTNGMNQSTHNYVAWCWKAGGAAVSNTDGALTSQVSANQSAGFSIATYTTPNGAATTFGHGLGKKPAFALFKARNNTGNWAVYHQSLGTNTIRLSSDDPKDTSADAFNSTAPTDTLMYLGTWAGTNGTNINWVSYLWSEIEGFSKFGSYTGIGGNNGTFINCGFKPAFLMIKRTDASGEWWMYDSSRGPTNPIPRMLMANNSSVEQEDSASYLLDFVSNGFKWRSGLDAAQGDGNTYLYVAFAESPFQTANAK